MKVAIPIKGYFSIFASVSAPVRLIIHVAKISLAVAVVIAAIAKNIVTVAHN